MVRAADRGQVAQVFPENLQSLAVYFAPHGDVLASCQPFHHRPGLCVGIRPVKQTAGPGIGVPHEQEYAEVYQPQIGQGEPPAAPLGFTRCCAERPVELVVPIVDDEEIRFIPHEITCKVKHRKTVCRCHADIDDFDSLVRKDGAQTVPQEAGERPVEPVGVAGRCRTPETEYPVCPKGLWHEEKVWGCAGGEVDLDKISVL